MVKVCLLTDQLLQKIDAVVKNEQFGVEGLSKVNFTTQELLLRTSSNILH